jgi:hypothetical protein
MVQLNQTKARLHYEQQRKSPRFLEWLNMRILISNDDGNYSPGIQAPAEAAAQFGNVRIVAPNVEQSSMGRRDHRQSSTLIPRCFSFWFTGKRSTS